MISVTVQIHVQKAMNRSKQVYLPYRLSTLGKALHAPSLGIRLSILVLEWCIGIGQEDKSFWGLPQNDLGSDGKTVRERGREQGKNNFASLSRVQDRG